MTDFPSPQDMSHAMLIAVLMNRGGSIDLPPDALDRYHLTGADGALHAVEAARLADGGLRLSVRPRPDTPDAGVRHRPAD